MYIAQTIPLDKGVAFKNNVVRKLVFGMHWATIKVDPVNILVTYTLQCGQIVRTIP